MASVAQKRAGRLAPDFRQSWRTLRSRRRHRLGRLRPWVSASASSRCRPIRSSASATGSPTKRRAPTDDAPLARGTPPAAPASALRRRSLKRRFSSREFRYALCRYSTSIVFSVWRCCPPQLTWKWSTPPPRSPRRRRAYFGRHRHPRGAERARRRNAHDAARLESGRRRDACVPGAQFCSGATDKEHRTALHAAGKIPRAGKYRRSTRYPWRSCKAAVRMKLRCPATTDGSIFWGFTSEIASGAWKNCGAETTRRWALIKLTPRGRARGERLYDSSGHARRLPADFCRRGFQRNGAGGRRAGISADGDRALYALSRLFGELWSHVAIASLPSRLPRATPSSGDMRVFDARRRSRRRASGITSQARRKRHRCCARARAELRRLVLPSGVAAQAQSRRSRERGISDRRPAKSRARDALGNAPGRNARVGSIRRIPASAR